MYKKRAVEFNLAVFEASSVHDSVDMVCFIEENDAAALSTVIEGFADGDCVVDSVAGGYDAFSTRIRPVWGIASKSVGERH